MTKYNYLELKFRPHQIRHSACGQHIMSYLPDNIYTFLISRGAFYQKHTIDEASITIYFPPRSSVHTVKCKRRKKKEKYIYYMLRLLSENPYSNFAPDKVLLRVSGGAAAVKHVRKNVASFDDLADDEFLNISELGLYALTSADDRMGMSARFLVLQIALLKYFVHALAKKMSIAGTEAQLLSKLLDPYNPCVECSCSEISLWENIRFGDAVASIISSLRWLFTLEKSYESVAGLSTSAVWLVNKEDIGVLVECITTLASRVRELLSCRKLRKPSYSVEFSMNHPQSDYELRFVMDGKVVHALSNRYCSKVLDVFLGRAMGLIRNLARASGAYKERIDGKKLFLAIEWSEQSGPIDIALILTWLRGTLSCYSLDKVVILTTPLTYAHAVLAGLYLRNVLGKLKTCSGCDALLKGSNTAPVKTSILMTSGSDPVYVVALLKRLVREVKGEDGHMLYFLGGSTLHSMIASYILKKELRERVTVLSR